MLGWTNPSKKRIEQQQQQRIEQIFLKYSNHNPGKIKFTVLKSFGLPE